MLKYPMRIVFLGTPDFAVASLRAIVEANFLVVGVVTAPDRPSGRGLQVHETPVKQYAAAQGIPILQPVKLKDPQFLADLAAWDADIQVVVAFRMLPYEVWAMPRLGTFNLHGSLLPDYRGAAPIHWAVIQGEKETGVTTFFLQQAIDTGDILLQARTPIGPEETTGDVHDRLMLLGANLVVDTLHGIQENRLEAIPQPEVVHPKEAPKLFKETSQIDWSWPMTRIVNFTRGMNPFPSAWTVLDGKVFKILRVTSHPEAIDQLPIAYTSEGVSYQTDRKTFWRIAVQDGWIGLSVLQQEGKRKMEIDEFLRGYRWPSA